MKHLLGMYTTGFELRASLASSGSEIALDDLGAPGERVRIMRSTTITTEAPSTWFVVLAGEVGVIADVERSAGESTSAILRAGAHGVLGAGAMLYTNDLGEPPAVLLVDNPRDLALVRLGLGLETSGRLAYIDGCRDTLLLSPARRGEACLNALYFPPGVLQTRHTHPDIRVGAVMSGEGMAVITVEKDGERREERFALVPGDVFVLGADVEHAFETGDEDLVIVAYHPTTNFGPTGEDHPMVNRTIVAGIPASLLRGIRTREVE